MKEFGKDSPGEEYTRTADQSKESLRQLYEKYRPEALRFCAWSLYKYRVGTDTRYRLAVAEDIVQLAFQKFLQNPQSLPDPSRTDKEISNYIKGRVLWETADYVRNEFRSADTGLRKIREESFEALPEDVDDPPDSFTVPSPEDKIIDGIDFGPGGKVNKIIEQADYLTPREKTILIKRIYEDKTLDEVGKELNVTREAIRQIEFKALGKLRKHQVSKPK